MEVMLFNDTSKSIPFFWGWGLKEPQPNPSQPQAEGNPFLPENEGVSFA